MTKLLTMEAQSLGMRAVQSAVTALALLSSWPVLGLIVGAMAFGGTNAIMYLYLFVLLFSAAGLLIGIFTAFMKSVGGTWIAGASALAVDGLTCLFLCYYVFNRGKNDNNAPLQVGTIKAPIEVFYLAAILMCSAATYLCWQRIRASRKLKAASDTIEATS